jgi:hydroxyacylglutathione hydrolase
MKDFLAKDGIHSVYEIAPDTYRIDEKGIANTYLLVGEKKALLIDSGLGVGSIIDTIREITSLPVILALTHRHCDHAGGRGYFKDCCIHKNDRPLIYGILSSRFACEQLLKMNKVKGVKLPHKPYHSHIHYIDDSYVFDLGGRQVSILNVPGHTKGSIVFKDEKTHLMFTGDDVNTYLWMQLPGCTSLSEWLIGAKKVLALAKDYQAYGGHDKGLISEDSIAKLISTIEELLKHVPSFEGKNLDYPLDKDIFPRVFVAKKNIK